MLSQIQRFGGAMFTPVLLFPFAGIVVGIAIMLRNPLFVGEALTAPDNLFAQIVHIIEEGAGPRLPGGADQFSDLELLYQCDGDDMGSFLWRRLRR